MWLMVLLSTIFVIYFITKRMSVYRPSGALVLIASNLCSQVIYTVIAVNGDLEATCSYV
jgi:hypothetical protein